jgi:hypothetical protein
MATGRSFSGRGFGQFAQKYMPDIVKKFEFKLPEKCKGTFIEKWGKYKHFNIKISEGGSLLGYCTT